MEETPNQPQSLSMQAVSNPSLPTLRFGDSGDAVRVLQKLLLCNRYSVRIDGNFGALTETAIKSFQNQRNLVADGIVGSRTWRELTK
ncbi:MAG: peptidoglycan-binding protein [Fischerella sp.]|jgi:peptidoglycan hydrolase-like protein with peptidoglycan-binding domain|uniref:peptidoglycan-binding domain-containing protein n=1 Tax=unclassified Fischerella TaxID=494603 RepID=UPI0004AEB3F1|nr:MULTISPECIES: peptidoglycan-binding domain-containing protein [unclassified Fischerella]NWF62586.1 peptidoglycan-binding protein [Fischerella sp.]